MKRLLTGTLITSMLVVPAMAQDVTVYLNNEKMIFDQNPIIENGRTLVPLRSIFEGLGAEVKWNPDIQEIKGITSGKEIVLRVGETSATVNGNTVTLDVPAKIENGRTLVPLRFISESLEAEVKWNADEYRIDIESVSENNNDIKIEYKLFEETIKDDKTGQELLVIEYKYPQFEEKNELLKSLNKKYNDNIDLLVKEKEKIIKYAKDYNEKTNGTGALPFRIYNDIKVTYNNNNIISIVNMLSDWWGEDFPVDAYDYNTENYDILTGKEIMLTDIINKPQGEIENMLNNKFAEEYNMEIDMRYVKFYLTDNGIMYNYNVHYEIGPYEF